VMSIFIDDAVFKQIAKSARTHFLQVAPMQITAKLVNGNLQHQFGRQALWGLRMG
jgi:hypothetical protein